jgi:hypothetical protein
MRQRKETQKQFPFDCSVMKLSFIYLCNFFCSMISLKRASLSGDAQSTQDFMESHSAQLAHVVRESQSGKAMTFCFSGPGFLQFLQTSIESHEELGTKPARTPQKVQTSLDSQFKSHNSSSVVLFVWTCSATMAGTSVWLMFSTV